MAQQKTLSPEKYILTRARSLPIDACYINKVWKESGLANIVIARKHSNGNYTIGIYLTDLMALGVKDSFYLFNKPEETLQDILNKSSGSGTLIPADYVLVHNIIYGANAFAEDHGFKICKEFKVTRFILEEDTEDIELIELEFGNDGKPLVIGNLI